MKSRLLRYQISLFLLLALGFGQNKAFGSILGGELGYSIDKNKATRISLVVYTDCSTNPASTQQISVKDKSTGKAESITARLVSSEDLMPICASACTQCKSNSCAQSYGLNASTYVVDLSSARNLTSDACEIQVSWKGCCRNIGDEQGIYLESSFNRCAEGGNNSPTLSNAPLTVLFAGQEHAYNLGIKDDDSTVVSLVSSRLTSEKDFDYGNRYSSGKPLEFFNFPHVNAPYPGGFHLDKHSGHLQFMPMKEMSSHLTFKIEEFRNGVKIGEIVRDQSVQIIHSENHHPIITGIDGQKTYKIAGCPGKEISFQIKTEERDGDKIQLSWDGGIDGASFQVNSALAKPVADFKWTPKAEDARSTPYYFVVKAQDDGCDINGVSYQVFEVVISPAFEVDYVSEMIACKKAKLQASPSFDLVEHDTYSYDWSVANGKFTGSQESLEAQFDEAGTKQVSITITSDQTGCKATLDSDVVIPGNPTANAGSDLDICTDQKVTLNAKGGSSYRWKPSSSLLEIDVPNPIVAPGTDEVFIVTVFDDLGCSDVDSVQVSIIEVDAKVFSANPIVCPGTFAEFTASGGSSYRWPSFVRTLSTDRSKAKALVEEDVEIPVEVTDENGCIGIANLSIQVDDDCVWPGDVDGNGVADKFDLLYMGIAFGEKNANREEGILEWVPQRSIDWPANFENGRNYKHADATGDGIVNEMDVDILDRNYHSSHNYATKNKRSSGGPQLSFKYSKDTAYAGDTLEIVVSLGTKDNKATNAYGVAFSITYDSSLIAVKKSFNLDLSNSWLFDASKSVSIKKNLSKRGIVDIGIVRTDKVPQEGFGVIAKLGFVIEDNIQVKNWIYSSVKLDASAIKLIDNLGKDIDFKPEYDELHVKAYKQFASVQEVQQGGLEIYPNPASSILNLVLSGSEKGSVRIFNNLGQVVLEKNIAGSMDAFVNIEDLASGTYLIRFSTPQGALTGSFVKQ